VVGTMGNRHFTLRDPFPMLVDQVQLALSCSWTKYVHLGFKRSLENSTVVARGLCKGLVSGKRNGVEARGSACGAAK
jgi:hypothetical protein